MALSRSFWGSDAFRTGASLVTANVLIQLAQLPYMMVSARVLSPAAFGAYAAGLVLVGIPGFLLIGHFSTAVTIAPRLSSAVMRQLMATALRTGLLCAVLCLLLAYPWSILWSVQENWALVAVLGLGTTWLPAQLMMIALARRYQRLHQLAIGMLASGLLAVLASLAAVLLTREAVALVVQPLLASGLLVATHPFWLGFRLRLTGPRAPLPVPRRLRWGDGAAQLIEYAAMNAGAWITGVMLGASMLGQWNRAQTLGATPIALYRSSAMEVLFGHYSRSGRTGSSDTHEPSATSFRLIVLAGALAGASLSPLVPVLLGHQWTSASSLVVPLTLSAAIYTGMTSEVVRLRVTGAQGVLIRGTIASSLLLAPVAIVAHLLSSADVLAWGFVAQFIVLLAILHKSNQLSKEWYASRFRMLLIWLITVLIGSALTAAGARALFGGASQLNAVTALVVGLACILASIASLAQRTRALRQHS